MFFRHTYVKTAVFECISGRQMVSNSVLPAWQLVLQLLIAHCSFCHKVVYLYDCCWFFTVARNKCMVSFSLPVVRLQFSWWIQFAQIRCQTWLRSIMQNILPSKKVPGFLFCGIYSVGQFMSSYPVKLNYLTLNFYYYYNRWNQVPCVCCAAVRIAVLRLR